MMDLQAREREAARMPNEHRGPLSSLSALDRWSLRVAQQLAESQPRCDLTIGQLPVAGYVGPTDLLVIQRNGNDYAIPAGQLVNAVPMSSVFNVQSYGAVGDYSNDDTAAIQKAVNACAAAGGGVVYFPTPLVAYGVQAVGTSYAVTVPSNVTLMGAGTQSLVKQLPTATLQSGLFTGTNVSNVTMQNIAIAGNGSSPGAGFSYFALVYFSGSSNLHFINVRATNSPSGMIAFDGCSYVWFDSCQFLHSGYNATTAFFCPMLNAGMTNHSDHFYVKNCQFVDALFHAIWLTASDSIVDGCSFNMVGESRVVAGDNRITVTNCIDNDGYMVSVTGPFVEAFVDDLIVTDNKVFNAGNYAGRFAVAVNACGGIIACGGNTIIANNLVVNATATGIAPWKDVVSSYNPLSGQNVVIANNTVVGCGTLSTNNPSSATYGGIVLVSVSGGSYSNVSIVGNSLIGNGGAGNLVLGAPVTTGTLNVRGNSNMPESVSSVSGTVTGSAAWTKLASVSVDGFSLNTQNGLECIYRCALALTTGTAELVLSYGGNSLLVLTGTFVVGDTITYTFDGAAVVTYTVPANPTLASIATALAAAINGSTAGSSVTAAVTTSQSSFLTGNVASANVLISAKDAAYQTSSDTTHGASTSSAAGLATLGGTTLIQVLAAYTTAAAAGNTAIKMTAHIEASANVGLQDFGSDVILGTTIESNTLGSSVVDMSMPQGLQVWGTLSAAGDAIGSNQLLYTR